MPARGPSGPEPVYTPNCQCGISDPPGPSHDPTCRIHRTIVARDLRTALIKVGRSSRHVVGCSAGFAPPAMCTCGRTADWLALWDALIEREASGGNVTT